MSKFELSPAARKSDIKEKTHLNYSEIKVMEKECLKDIERDVRGTINTPSRLIKASDMTKNITAPKWLIKPFIPEEGLLEFIGASGSYKSFIVLDMLFCISAGIEYHGFKVERGTVVYIAGEGANGVKARLKALELNYNVNEYDFYVLPMPSNLSDFIEVEQLSNEIKAISPDGVAITIFDTLHRNSAGSDENSSKDFATILGNIDNLIKPLSKVVGWVHHTGLGEDAKARGRGTSSRYGALDTQIIIDRTKDHHAVMKNSKQKDSDPFLNVSFELEKVGIEIEDEDGNEIVSLVPVRVEGEAYKPKSKLKKEHHELLNCLRLAINQNGRTLSDEVKEREHIIEGRCLSVSEWKTDAMKVIISNGDEDLKKQTDAKSKTFARRKKDLIDEGQIGEYDNVVWIESDCKKDIFHNWSNTSSSD